MLGSAQQRKDATFRTGWKIHTEIFEGPLDLLLYLVKKDGVDLRDISIARIADEYLEYLDRLRELHLGIAAEYLVMAATLCHLKSLELLPRPPTHVGQEEEKEDPRENLVQRLVDYQRFKEAAQSLDELPTEGRDVFSRDAEKHGAAPRPVRSKIDIFGLLDVYYDVLHRHEISHTPYEVGESGPDISVCCQNVLGQLGGHKGQATLQQILAPIKRKLERILAFLAVLEMARLGWVGLEQDEHLADIWITSHVESDHDISLVAGAIAVETT